MNAFLTALEAKFIDSTIYNDVSGRVYFNRAESSDYPRVIYSIISGNPDNVFNKKGESLLMQVDLFSAVSAGKTEIMTMYTDLTALLDDCSLTIDGNVLVGFKRVNTIGPMDEEVDSLPDGSSSINHIAVDYSIDYQAT